MVATVGMIDDVKLQIKEHGVKTEQGWELIGKAAKLVVPLDETRIDIQDLSGGLALDAYLKAEVIVNGLEDFENPIVFEVTQRFDPDVLYGLIHFILRSKSYKGFQNHIAVENQMLERWNEYINDYPDEF